MRRPLRVVKGRRFDGGCRLKLLFASVNLDVLRSDRQELSDPEIVEELDRLIADLDMVRRYILDPKGVWR